MKCSGFTLAEILITLGIIGVVAAITIPGLINSYRKKVYGTQLKETYSLLAQAVRLSEEENGTHDGWIKTSMISNENGNYDNESNYAELSRVFKQYFEPYLKVAVNKIETDGYFILMNGTKVRLYNGACIDYLVFLGSHGDISTTVNGANLFHFVTCSNDETPIRAWCGDYSIKTDRQTLLNACKTTNPHACTCLVQKDNFEFKNDYPIKLR